MKAESSQDGEESWGSCRGARILVVDDDPDMRALLASRLEKVGCVAREAASGLEAQGILASSDPAYPDRDPPRSRFGYLLKQDVGVAAQGEPLDRVGLCINARVFDMRTDAEMRDEMEVQSAAHVEREA
jgi:CheY-like chemotaxis protein